MKPWKRMLSLALVLTMAVCLLPAAALRTSAEIIGGDLLENLWWEFDTETETLTISGTGEMDFNWDMFDEEAVRPWKELDLNDFIHTVVIEEGVTNIAYDAFSFLDNLDSISIPNTVTSLDTWAFFSSGLPSIVIPDSVQVISTQAFAYCRILRSITFGSGLKIIGGKAFNECKRLPSIKIPDSVTDLGEGCFEKCSALKQVEIGKNVKKLQSGLFTDCVSLRDVLLPAGLTTINSTAFQNTPALTDVYYGGDAAAWAQISGASYIDLTTVRLHCGVEQIEGHWTVIEQEAPTCLEPGFLSEVCACGYYREEVPSALGHDMGAWIGNRDGTHSRNCTVCGQARETADCTFAADVVPPTATEPGFTVYTCTGCGYSYIGSETEPLSKDYTVRFSVPPVVDRPADRISNTFVGITLPTVEAPEGYTFLGWVLEDYDNVEVCPENILTGSYTAPCDVTLKALFRYAPEDGLRYELVTEKLPESEKAGRYVLTTGKTAEGYMMRAITDSYTGNPEGMTRISDSGAALEDGVLRNVPLENVFQITLSDTEERYWLSPVTMPERYVSVSDTSLLTTATELSDSCKWRIGYASRTGRYGFLPHTDETQCINCDGTAFVLSTIQGNSGQFLWKQKGSEFCWTTEIRLSPTETPELHIYNSVSVGTDMVLSMTVRKSEAEGYKKVWVEVIRHEPEGDRTFRIGEDQPDGELTESGSTWVGQFRHIFAKEMGLDIEVSLYALDETGKVWKSPSRVTNIRDYLAGRLLAGNNTVEQRILAADMLNYGAAAQMFTGFQTDHLVNEELSAEALVKLREYETAELPPVEKTNCNTRPEGQSNLLFNSVTLGNEVLLNLTVRLAEGTKNVRVLVKDHATGNLVTTLDTAWTGSSFQAIFSGIGADKMRTEYDFVTLVNGVETGNTRTWSVEAYVGEIRAEGIPLKVAMANALLAYGDSAAAYFAAQ